MIYYLYRAYAQNQGWKFCGPVMLNINQLPFQQKNYRKIYLSNHATGANIIHPTCHPRPIFNRLEK